MSIIDAVLQLQCDILLKKLEEQVMHYASCFWNVYPLTVCYHYIECNGNESLNLEYHCSSIISKSMFWRRILILSHIIIQCAFNSRVAVGSQCTALGNQLHILAIALVKGTVQRMNLMHMLWWRGEPTQMRWEHLNEPRAELAVRQQR